MRDVNRTERVGDEAHEHFTDSFAIEYGDAPELGRGARRIQRPYRYLVQNRTPFLIQVEHPEREFGVLVLPPFAERVVAGSRLAPFEQCIRGHRQRHELLVSRYEPGNSAGQRIWVVWLLLVLALAVTAFYLVWSGTLRRNLVYVTWTLPMIALFVVLVQARAHERRRRRRADMSAAEEGDTASGMGAADTDGNETVRSARQLLTLVLVITVGAALPTIAIAAATDLHQFLVMEGGLRVKAGLESRFVSRVLQITYTCVLSLFPALLYFQFDRQRAGDIRHDWIKSLFRMDGRLRTVADVHATYGDSLFEATSHSHDSVRGLGGKHSPIVVCTILIALGWTILVARTESFDFSATTAAAQQTALADDEAARAGEAAEAASAADASAEARTEAATAAVSAAGSATAAQEATAGIAEVSTQGSDAADGTDVTAAADGTGGTAAADGTDVTAAADETDGTAGADETDGEPVGPSAPAPTPATLPDGPLTAEEASAVAGGAAVAADLASQQAATEEARIQTTPFFQLLAPNPSAAGMAFLGAYFYGVYLVLRSYFRGDLRSKIYNQITARLVTIVVVAYLINALFVSSEQQEVVWVLSFLAGVVPTTVVDRVLAGATSVGQWVVGDTRMSSDRPLAHIDGLDLYDCALLESEGIPDVAALAAGDLSNLMIRTKLPIGRLVDWADQAALIVVVGAPGPRLDPRVRRLRTRGIRTGTDLLAAVEGGSTAGLVACLRTPPAAIRKNVGARAVHWTAAAWAGRHDDPQADDADQPANGDEDARRVAEAPIDLEALRLAVRRQPVMMQVLQWRSSPFADVDRTWISLPEFGSSPGPSTSYRGPLPTPRTGARARPAMTIPPDP